MRLCCWLVLAGSALAFQPPAGLGPGAPSGIIEGKVVDAVTGEAIPQAKVTLTPIRIVMGIRPSGRSLGDDFYDPGQMPANRVANTPPTTLTVQENGTFRTPMPSGRLQIRADCPGYVAPPAGTNTLSLIPGETLKGVTLKLIKQATVLGRILDAEGKPAANVRVQCLRWTAMGQNGQRVLVPQYNATTDERGDYRIAGIYPGRYHITADADPAIRDGSGYVTLFAPGVADFAAAQAVELPPGQARTDVDFRLRRYRLAEVSGRVQTSPEGPLPPGSIVMLQPGNPALQLSMSRQYFTHVNPDGSFLVRHVPPGSYVLNASGGEATARYSASVKVVVADGDLPGIAVMLKPGVRLRGKILAGGDPPLDSVNLFFQPRTLSFSGGGHSRVDAEGRFAVASLEPAVYRLQASGLPKGYYVKSVRRGRVETADTVDLADGAPGDVVVTLEDATGEVSGKVVHPNQQPASDVQVIVVNAAGETVTGTYSLIDGAYRISELPPGAYRIFAVADADISDPATLERLAGSAHRFTLAPTKRETLDLELK